MECQHHFDRAYIYLHTPCSLLAVKCVGGRCRWLLMLLLPCCKRGALRSVLKTVTSNYQYFLCNGLSYLSRESKYPACNKITMKTANLSPVCFFYVNESNNDQLSWRVGQLLVSRGIRPGGGSRPEEDHAKTSPPVPRPVKVRVVNRCAIIVHFHGLLCLRILCIVYIATYF